MQNDFFYLIAERSGFIKYHSKKQLKLFKFIVGNSEITKY